MPFKLRAEHRQAIIDHALSLKPVEACGIIASKVWYGGQYARLLRMNNVAEEWGDNFEFEPEQQLAVWNDLENRGEVIAAVYHSHTRHPAWPSARDIAGARAVDRLTTHLIVSVQDDKPVVRGFLINGEQVAEIHIEEI